MVRLENVSKYYVGNNEVALGLRKINLEFTEGELVAITGESGSGKSTLLNVISGSDTYEEGELYIEEQPTSYFDESDWEHYRRDYIGFIYQNYNLIDSYTVFDNVNVALLVKGGTEDNAKKVMEYLDKVGLKEHAGKRATQLSSGQKQRLAIARALAKETRILVADEPTGNLDSENSAEIMRLLNELSTDKLVFVVTHNYDEIEQYATRKIRMYDGEVAEDIVLREKKLSGNKISAAKDIKKEPDVIETSKKENRKKRSKVSGRIANLNRRSRPVTSAFLIGFMIIIAAAFYILLGNFFSNLDNTTSKIFDDRKFTNDDKTRIIVRKEDDSVFSHEELDSMADLKYVEKADMYDCMSDTYYMLTENEDFKFHYNVQSVPTSEPDYIKPYAIKRDKFMKSTTCLTEDDLSAGVIGTELYDIVMYTDESNLGKEITIYLGNVNMWNADVAEITCTVTGILKEETDQIYFSEKMGSMLQNNPNKYLENLKANIDGLDEKLEGTDMSKDELNRLTLGLYARIFAHEPAVESSKIVIKETENKEELEAYMIRAETKTMVGRPIFFVNEELTYNEVIVSDEFRARAYIVNERYELEPHDFSNILLLTIYSGTSGSIIEDNAETERLRQENSIIFTVGFQAGLFNVVLEGQEQTSLSTAGVIQVSEELYEKLIGYSASDQIALYIEDYAHTDSVLSDLKGMGYEAASVYRAAAVEYDMELVQRKAVSMGISLGAFVLVFFIGVFILGLIMALRMRDFNILRLLGMEKQELNDINKKDIITNMGVSTAAALAVIFVMNILEVSYIVNIVKYYRLPHYIIYAAALAAFSWLLSTRAKAKIKSL